MLMATKPPKPRMCKVCHDHFVPARPFQRWCSPECGLVLATQAREKAAKKKAAEERKDHRERKDKLKTRGDWQREAQASFNAWVRARDAGRTCICCDKPFEPDRIGGSVDAGHYLSVGSAPHLRFVESNVHAQRKSCNRPGGTTRASFRAGMVARIGLEAVEALEADQEPRHYSIDDLKAIKALYAAKRRELEKA